MNIERAVLMMARVEVANLNDQWNQAAWGVIDTENFTPAMRNGEVIYDEETGLPLGVGSCSTAMCAAGWALHDSPLRLMWYASGDRMYVDECDNGQPVSTAACEWLGINRPNDATNLDDYDEDDDPGERSDDRWNYNEDMPHLFDSTNTIAIIYDRVMAYLPNISRAHFVEMVEDKMLELQRSGVSR